jgi:hypothetical protein
LNPGQRQANIGADGGQFGECRMGKGFAGMRATVAFMKSARLHDFLSAPTVLHS